MDDERSVSVFSFSDTISDVLFVEKVPKLLVREKLGSSAHHITFFHQTQTVSLPKPPEFIALARFSWIDSQNSQTDMGTEKYSRISFFKYSMYRFFLNSSKIGVNANLQ